MKIRLPGPHTRPNRPPWLRIPILVGATLAVLGVLSPTARGAGKGVYDRWDKVAGKTVPIKDPADIPEPSWVPLSPDGTVILWGLGTVRIAVPCEESIVVRTEKKEVVLEEGKAQKFTGRYPGGRRGSVPVFARKGEKGWAYAVAAVLKAKIGRDVVHFADADGNGIFTDYGVDVMVRGDFVAGEGGEKPAWEKVPGHIVAGKQRYLLAFQFPDTCFLCRLGEEVPDHAGPHNGYLNRMRAYGGYLPVGISMRIYDGQVKHCRYMAKNGLCHAEDQSKPEYTPEGSRAGEMSVCGGGGSAEESLRGMIGTLYHSYDYLYAKVKTVCYAYEEGKYSCHVDAVSAHDTMIYPYRGQDHVEPAGRNENPDPYPQGAARPGGTFVRFLPPTGKKEFILALKVTDLVTGENVPAKYTDPSCVPASVSRYNFSYMLRSICVFPQEVLKSGHVYQVEILVGSGKRNPRKLETIFRVR